MKIRPNKKYKVVPMELPSGVIFYLDIFPNAKQLSDMMLGLNKDKVRK